MDVTEEKFHSDISETSRASEENFLLSPHGEESFEHVQVLKTSSKIHLTLLYFTNLITIIIVFVVLLTNRHSSRSLDPSLEGVYCMPF